MNDPSKYPVFTAADIQRYHAGTMSAAERNALEKAALEDPFLADALEGYVHTTTVAADIENIHLRLTEKIKNKRSTVPFFRNNLFMRVAAVTLLVIGAGLFISRLNTDPQKELAGNKKTVTPSSPVQEENQTVLNNEKGLFTDTISPADELVFTKPKIRSKEGAGYIAPTNVFKVSPADNGNNNAGTTNMEVSAAPTSILKSTFSLTKDSSRAVAISDLNGVEIKGDSIKNLNIVMVESDQVLNEVVVLDKRQNRGAVNKPPAVLEEIEPIGGWEDYNNYALSNLKPPPGSDAKPQTGDVVLSFDINPEGEPTNIKIIQSFCSNCELEAKRILQEGPKWKNRNKKNAKIRIRF
jgi:hypothetical protein